MAYPPRIYDSHISLYCCYDKFMTSTKRHYYRRGKAILDDSLRSTFLEAVEDRAQELAKQGDAKELSNFLKKVADPAKIGDIADKMAEEILSRSRRATRKAVRFEQKQKRGFEKRLHKTYEGSISAYTELLGVSIEAIENHRKITYENLGEKDAFLPFLLRLHARAYRNANEILALMQAGYGSGALARWRSMHETVVVMSYAKEQGPRVIRFMKDHEAVSAYKAMKVYQEHVERLAQQPFSAKDVRQAKAKYDRRLLKYGKEFRKDYGWAWAASGHKLHNFRELEEHVGIDHLYPYYKLSSLNVHMEWRSLFVGEEFEALNDPGVALIGPADYGFEDAVSLSLLTLSYATIMILTYNLSYESMIYAKVVMAAERRAQEELGKDIDKVKSKR